MSLIKDIKKQNQKVKKNVADIGAAAQTKTDAPKEDVLIDNKKCKLKENISIRLNASVIDLPKRKWFNPVFELIFKKGTEVKPIKVLNSGTLIDIPLIGDGAFRVGVPNDILSKGQKLSKLKP